MVENYSFLDLDQIESIQQKAIEIISGSQGVYSTESLIEELIRKYNPNQRSAIDIAINLLVEWDDMLREEFFSQGGLGIDKRLYLNENSKILPERYF